MFGLETSLSSLMRDGQVGEKTKALQKANSKSNKLFVIHSNFPPIPRWIERHHARRPEAANLVYFNDL